MTTQPEADLLRSVVEHDFEFGLAYLERSGPLDPTTAPAARAAILKCAAEHPQAIIVDVARVIPTDRLTLFLFPSLATRLVDQDIALLLVAHPNAAVADALR